MGIVRRDTFPPISLGEHFKLTATGMLITGKPTIEQWTGIGIVLKRMSDATPYAIGEWLAYGYSRKEWQSLLDEAIDATGLSQKTLLNQVSVVRSVGVHEREIAPSPSHASAVQGLPRPEQTKYLQRARDEGLTREELRRHIRADKRSQVIDGKAEMAGMFRVFYADPWPSGLSVTELCKMPVAAHAERNAVLFLWVPASQAFANPGAREVIEAWGFRPTSGMVWDKVRGESGEYVRVHHKHLVIATRGQCPPENPECRPDSVQVFRRESDHADNPKEFRQFIQKMYPKGRRVELFAMAKVEGWVCLGHNAALWADEMAAHQ